MRDSTAKVQAPQPESPRRRLLTLLVLFLLLLLALSALGAAGADDAGRAEVVQPAALGQAGAPVYGVNFITSAEEPADDLQFQNGLATGATWNRWPLYWFNIEQNPGQFDWSRQDRATRDDIKYGLRTNAILLGTPGFYTSSFTNSFTPYRHRPRQGLLALEGPEKATPMGLYEPVFTDGDAPGPGKTINPNNKWALFVHKAVNRYKPGGVLAQQDGWPAGVGITHWEMWNEPDLTIFWDASLGDYARLLKVGYLSAKHADPNAQVMFGALANNFQLPNYYEDVLSIYDVDPLAAANNYFHDILATHSYFHAWNSWYHVWRAENTLAERSLSKPIWFNENGVPSWDDYPGPVWDPMSALRATVTEQAAYTIQSAFYALYAGADAVFHFQLYDGCGNQPSGTDFPPHNGELCDANGQFNGKPCAGDANGLFRNPNDAACFRQHPQPESPRPNFTAFKVLTTYVRDVEPYWRTRPGEPLADPTCPAPGGPQEWIALYQPATQTRVVGLWARCGRAETAVIPATNPAGTAQLVALDGTVQQISAINGVYTIALPAATNRNPFPGQTINSFFPIGGLPYILIEPDFKDGTPPTPTPEVSPTPAATPTPLPPEFTERALLPAVLNPYP